MNLADCTEPRLILPRLNTRDAPGIIQELSQAMQQAGRIVDLLRFYHTALNRELMVSSEVESGVAFPHGRAAEIAEVVFAMGRTEAPVAWGSNLVPAVRLVFLVGVPEGDAGQFLTVACALSHLARNASLMDQLLRSSEVGEILSILRSMPVREAAACASSLGLQGTHRGVSSLRRPDSV